MDKSHLHEGFDVLEAILKAYCHGVRVSFTHVDSTYHIILEASTDLPPRPFLSRIIAVTLGLESYTIQTHVLPNQTYPLRMSNLIRSAGTLSTSDPIMTQHFYVVSGLDKARKAPLGSFLSRHEAESSITSGRLQKRLTASTLEAFENLVVEKWLVGEVNEDPFSTRLTLYSVDGTMLLSFPEEQPIAKRNLGRLTSILASSLNTTD